MRSNNTYHCIHIIHRHRTGVKDALLIELSNHCRP